VGAVLGLWSVLSCAKPVAYEEPLTDGRYTMGTILEITLPAGSPEDAFEELFDLARKLDSQLSSYSEASDVSRLNRSAGLGPTRVSAEVREILELSIEYSRRTGGSFDVTIGPMVELWMQAADRGRVPTRAELEAARNLVGSQKIRISADGTVGLDEKGMSINLGGIAKGYALDRMLPLLRARGIESALLSFGQSSTWAVGAPPGTPGWRLLVRGIAGDFVGLITLRDQAFSVSESLGQWVEIEGERFGHIVDPSTGQPLIRERQALVVAPTAALAEALSKLMLVADAADALSWVTAQAGCEGLLIESGGELSATPGWANVTRFEPLSEPTSDLPARQPSHRAGSPQDDTMTVRSPVHGTGRPDMPDL
jgi:thiamine biosynthesis lipoprotein